MVEYEQLEQVIRNVVESVLQDSGIDPARDTEFINNPGNFRQQVQDGNIAVPQLSSDQADTLQQGETKIQELKQKVADTESLLEVHEEVRQNVSHLQAEVKKVTGEEKTLEQLAAMLDEDEDDLHEQLGKEEQQVNRLREHLDRIKQLEQKSSDLSSRLEQVEQEGGLQRIEQELENRQQVIEVLLQAQGGGGQDSGTGEPWMLVAKNPNQEPDWSQQHDDIFEDGWKWKPGFNWMNNKGAVAAQGWKIHVAVNPDNPDEVYRVAEAIMPVLNNLGCERKFANRAEELKRKGGETEVKLATIYPATDSNASDNVNQNRENTTAIIEELVNALDSAGLLAMTAPVETLAEFNVEVNGTSSRIFTRYDQLGGIDIQDKDTKIFGQRKPGAVPEGFENSTGIDLSNHRVEELPGLETLSSPAFSITLPQQNFD